MKKLLQYVLLVVFIITAGNLAKAQTYLHPTAGIAGEYVGACEVATCSGTFLDDGGGAFNYSTFIGYPAPGGVYRVFCPNQAGRCMRASFNSFSIEGGFGCPWDKFTITNSSTQNGPILWEGCGTGSLGTWTATTIAPSNGCLSFRFISDNTVTLPGWSATLSCVPCAGGPNGTDNNDCSNSTLVCSNQSVPSNSTGPGIVAEACGGAAGCPAGGENYSNWYTICFTTGGTFNFSITPTVGTDDYDYALFGPTLNCGTLGPAVRCSDAALTGLTGLSGAAADVTEDVNGNKFTATMNVLAGECYYLMVDEWTPTGAGYNLSFGGTATISCTLLPVELASFTASYDNEDKEVGLDWTTAAEFNHDYFAIEHSIDGSEYKQIGTVRGAGNSSQLLSYSWSDKDPAYGELNYYRLKQVDFDGKFRYSDVEAVFISDFKAQFNIFPNPAGESAEMIFNTANVGEYQIQIFDNAAKLILSYNFKSGRGENHIPLDLAGFSKGVYFVTLQGNGSVLKSSFIKE